MPVPQTFRSAFNGFNREDVVRYIEYLNTKHSTETNQLKSELQSMKAELALAREDVVAKLKADEALEEANRRCAELEQERIQLLEQLEQAGRQPESALDTSDAKELEVYRRAERVERMAQERAAQVHRQTAEVLADATLKVDEAAGQIEQITGQVADQLTQLQNAVVSSKMMLHDAAAAMDTLRPETEEE